MDNFYQNCPAKMSDGRFLRDSRSSHRRELHNMKINGITNHNNHRLHLQQNAEKIMDGEWCSLRNNQSCHTYPCFHNYPTRSTPGMLHKEMAVYNAVKTGNSQEVPGCEDFLDYRATQTGASEKKCAKKKAAPKKN